MGKGNDRRGLGNRKKTESFQFDSIAQHHRFARRASAGRIRVDAKAGKNIIVTQRIKIKTSIATKNPAFNLTGTSLR
jgi:hypothetical protein